MERNRSRETKSPQLEDSRRHGDNALGRWSCDNPWRNLLSKLSVRPSLPGRFGRDHLVFLSHDRNDMNKKALLQAMAIPAYLFTMIGLALLANDGFHPWLCYVLIVLMVWCGISFLIYKIFADFPRRD